MQERVSILLVNSLPGNLHVLDQFLGKEGYLTIPAATYEAFDQALTEASSPSAALVDISGFNAEIWPRCEQLRSKKVPFLVISPRQSAAIQQASISHGARGVMVKPLVIRELIGIIRSMLAE